MLRWLVVLAGAVIEGVVLGLLTALLAAIDTSRSVAAVAPATLAAAVVLGYVLATLLLRWRGTDRAGRLTFMFGAALGAGALVALDHRAMIARLGDDPAGLIIALGVTLFAWSRGAVLARDDRTGTLFDAVYASFRRNMLILLGVLLLSAAASGPGARYLGGMAWGSTLLFFLAGLCALSLARVDEEQRRAAGMGGTLAVRGEWLATVSVVVAVVLLTGVVLARLISPGAVGALLAPFGLLFDRLADLLVLILTPLFMLLGALAGWLVVLIGPLHPRPFRPAPVLGRPGRLPASRLHPLLTPQQTAHLALIVAAVVVAFVGLWYAYARLSGSLSPDDGEERESLWSWSLVGAALRDLLHRRGQERRADGEPITADGASAIRTIYRRLLGRASSLGYARNGPETPQEYLGRLRRIPIEDERDASFLTAAYMRVRYGDQAERPEDVARAQQAWARLEQTLRRGADEPDQT